jgi:spermidine/putrescine transport system ATP-binding protein
MIAGFEQPDAGCVLLDGRDLADTPPERRPVHTVFQSYALFPHMTVAENVAFPLRMARVEPAETRTRVREALENVRLSDKAASYPHELSGGQKQRVALARGLVNRPRLLLLDEPLGALDARLREEMQLELINLQKGLGVTFVFVTHAQYEALALSHRIAVMNEGRVEQLDEPSRIYGFPKNRFVADFIGNINMQVAGVGEVAAPPASAARSGQSGVFAVRPEQVHISARAEAHPLKNHFRGQVRGLLYIGDVTTFVVELEGGARIQALLPNSAPGRAQFFVVGDTVALAWRRDAGVYLSE